MTEDELVRFRNRYQVAANKERVVVGDPPPSVVLTADDALLFAAWLVIYAQPRSTLHFETVLSTIRTELL